MTATAGASAQKSDKLARAQILFEEGVALMKAGKHAEACPKLAQSDELDPGTGTKYRLAECYEGSGRVASAWALYVVVADESRKAARSDRQEQARKRADELRPKLPELTITVPASVAAIEGLELKRDGELVVRSDFDQKIPV